MKPSKLAILSLALLMSFTLIGCSVQDSTQPAVGSISADSKDDFALPAKTKTGPIKK